MCPWGSSDGRGFQNADAPATPSDHAIENGAVRKQARTGDADLTGIEKNRAGGGSSHFVDVDIGHQHHRRLAAELESDALHGIGGILVDELAHLGGSGEGDLVDMRMLHQAIAGGMAVAGDHVDDARRKTGFGHEIGKAQRRE